MRDSRKLKFTSDKSSARKHQQHEMSSLYGHLGRCSDYKVHTSSNLCIQDLTQKF